MIQDTFPKWRNFKDERIVSANQLRTQRKVNKADKLKINNINGRNEETPEKLQNKTLSKVKKMDLNLFGGEGSRQDRVQPCVLDEPV